ncbi:MAG: hypothetical protein ACLSUW_01645 [Akkermansia sp.]
MITAANLHRSYSIGKKSIEILHGVNLHIAAGERCSCAAQRAERPR